MPQRLKRRLQVQPETSPARLPTRQRRDDNQQEENESDSEHESESESDESVAEGEPDHASGAPPLEQMIKKLVRLALATEFSRLPLRRADIVTKVLEPHNRLFKLVFNGAQKALQNTFGMRLVELPSKEKVTIAQKRAAQRAGGTAASQGGMSASSKSWILTTTLPSSLRSAAILAPTRNPSSTSEAEYAGLYTFVVSTIYLSQGGRVSEGKLERYLQRLNASEYAAGGVKTDDALKRMEKEGYIVKVREREAGGEETVEWMLGPRAKVEIGEKGVAGMVRTVYGKTDGEMEELEDKLERSLGPGTFRRKTRKQGQGVEGDDRDAQEPQGEDTEQRSAGSQQRRSLVQRSSRQQRRSGLVNDEAEEDEEAEEEGEEEEEIDEEEDDSNDDDE